MTREERIGKLAELKLTAETLALSYNEAMQGGRFDKETEKSITDTVNEYTAVARDICFDDCKNTDDPMLAAVTMLSFMTIGTKDEKKGDDIIPVRVIVEKEKQIDLEKLHKYCGKIGKDENWSHIAQKLNMLLTAQKAVDLGLDPTKINDSYAMSEIARAFDMGKTPTSKTSLLKTMQTVITAMIGEEYKVTSHDVNYITSVYSRKNRAALTVTCANHKYFRNYVAEVCHRIVTGKKYEVDFKVKKDNG